MLENSPGCDGTWGNRFSHRLYLRVHSLARGPFLRTAIDDRPDPVVRLAWDPLGEGALAVVGRKSSTRFTGARGDRMEFRDFVAGVQYHAQWYWRNFTRRLVL